MWLNINVCMYLTAWYVNTYIQLSDVLCIHIQFFHKPPSGVCSVMGHMGIATIRGVACNFQGPYYVEDRGRMVRY